MSVRVIKSLPAIAGAAFVFLNVQAASADKVEEGAYLTAAAGCKACHTAAEADAVPFAGGHALKTPFGVFYTPNITPDIQNGIGAWSDADFLDALKKGLRPDGSHYFPSFPYPSYTKMTDEDALKIFAYLKSLPASDKVDKEHDVSAPFSWRWVQTFWKILFFEEGEYKAPSGATAAVARGGYLTNAVGHCGECHTPRNSMGGFDEDRHFGGSGKEDPAGEVPNITPHPTGIGDWSKGDLVSFFETGMKPNFDDVQGEMGEVITEGTSNLTPDDREAMAEYLLSLTPVETEK